jgi:hypothetical protein
MCRRQEKVEELYDMREDTEDPDEPLLYDSVFPLESVMFAPSGSCCDCKLWDPVSRKG